MRLRDAVTGIQILVPDEKAQRLIAAGTYAAVPDAEQPPKDTAPQKAPQVKDGPTSIAAALSQAAGPMWNQAL